MSTRSRAILIAALFPLCAGVCYCALACFGHEDRLTIVPVEGKVLVAGMPAGNANVYFYPCDPGQQRIPAAITAPDGTFRLTTISSGDGAPKGRYDVTVVWPDYSIPRDECAEPLHDRLKLQYADRNKTELHAVIALGKNEVILNVAMVGGGWSSPPRGSK